MAKLTSALPKGEANGLNAITRELIDNPSGVQVAVELFDCKEITTDIDTGDIEPIAQIRSIEPIKADRDQVAKIMRRAMEERTGKTVLPFDLEEDMRAAFEGIDPHTGEIFGG